MEKDTSLIYALSDPAILKTLGSFIKQTRLQQNKTQQQLATEAGINRSTIVQIENGGGGTLLSLIQIVRALEQLHLFKHFEIKQQLSPLKLAEIDQNKRKRASRKSDTELKKNKSDW